MRATATPREVAEALEAAPGRPHSQRERFSGYGVMGLPFESGHVLGLRRFPVSSIGPAYTSIWHRSPDGRWSFWLTAAPEVSCARYSGEVSDDTHQTAIRLAWPEPYHLTIAADDPVLSWEVTFAATPTSRALSALAQRLPGPFLARENVLRVLGPVAGTFLGAGRLALTGRMPNRQTFHLVPSHVWPVAASRAYLEGADLGRRRPRSPNRRPSATSAFPSAACSPSELSTSMPSAPHSTRPARPAAELAATLASGQRHVSRSAAGMAVAYAAATARTSVAGVVPRCRRRGSAQLAPPARRPVLAGR